ncbi:nucleoid-associated protein [Photobacterium sp. Alg240-V54]|uniref:nucleoid-associated protein n=1 Tax=Photobacterium sp. Alg240-V54 TaxID=2305995 RepID=UPI0013D31A42|nr:nucleoid-associated protein [Photobacterium sp. Alg240-V54]
MHLLDLNISKIAIHQIFQRDLDGNKIPPLKSNELINFDTIALETFKQRVIYALGSQSKAVNMVIVNQGSNDVATIIQKLCNANDDDFLNLSYDIADKLADSQKRKQLQGGIVVVFKGIFGDVDNRNTIIGIMKADIHSAYAKTKNESTNEISLEYVEEALLTPSTKLFKTAGFAYTGNHIDEDSDELNLNNSWEVYISDSQISQTDGKAAAQYFYANFLGCGYPETSARQTKDFYNYTCSFIDKLEISAEDKNDLRNSLVSYLKVENSEIVSAIEFSDRYFSVANRDLYVEYLELRELPVTAFTKDIEHITSHLKMRRLSFSKNIKIIAPSDLFQQLVQIKTIERNEAGDAVKWTNILIKDQIVNQG